MAILIVAVAAGSIVIAPLVYLECAAMSALSKAATRAT